MPALPQLPPFQSAQRLVFACLALAGGLAWAAPATQPPAPQPQPLAQGVWWIPGSYLPRRQPDGNSVVFHTPRGLVVFDTGRHRWHRQAILDLARSREAGVIAIVNSHWHLDHVSGNPDLRAAHPGVRVYASDAIEAALGGFLAQSAAAARDYLKTPGLAAETQEDIRGDLATTANGEALKPDVVIGASGERVLGGRRLELNLARHGPTAGDVWLYDPVEKLVASGDLVTLPVPFLDTACVAGWKSALAEVWARPFRILVPGHGQPMTREQFAGYREAFEAFVGCAASPEEAGACARGWVQAVAPLLEGNAMDGARAQRMAVYYVTEVLRRHGGNSASCGAPTG